MPIWTSEKDIGTAIETVVEINSTDSKWEFKANTILKTNINFITIPFFQASFFSKMDVKKGVVFVKWKCPRLQ